MIKQIKYNRLVQNFIVFLDSLDILTYSNGCEYVYNMWTTVIMNNDHTKQITIFYGDMESIGKLFTLSDEDIAVIIDEKFNKEFNYEIVINYGFGSEFKYITKVFKNGKGNKEV